MGRLLWRRFLISCILVTNAFGLPLYSYAAIEYDSAPPRYLTAPLSSTNRSYVSYSQSWSSVPYHQPSHLNTSHSPTQTIYYHSGPWDRAYDAVTNIIDRTKILKRSVFSAKVQQEIAQHLRPKDWWQKLKDLWRKLTGRKLKVTTSQYEQVKMKYRPARAYPQTRVPYRAQATQNGRVRSTLPARPLAGQRPTFSTRPSRFNH